MNRDRTLLRERLGLRSICMSQSDSECNISGGSDTESFSGGQNRTDDSEVSALSAPPVPAAPPRVPAPAAGTPARHGFADAPIYDPHITLHQVTRDVLDPMSQRPGAFWWGAFLVAISALGVGASIVALQLRVGLGILGLRRPEMWGTYIVNFVFWIGIGHAGTLISAILFLLRQRWRTAINRTAEAMTIFAVMCAGMFPLLHLGRTLLAYWLFPYPNSRELWVNFNSPLVWDVFAVSTYFTISLLFWYKGLLPDFATMRDRERRPWLKKIYTVLSLRWRGTARGWLHYETAYGLMAAIATPLVLSVHSVVSADFAVALVPGWHDTIFPPYFVAGAIFSGFAMVVTLLVILRKAYRLEKYITLDHLELMNKIILFTSSIVAFAYLDEIFMAWYSESPFEKHIYIWLRFVGPYAWAGWLAVFCNCIAPMIFWFRRARRSLVIMFVVSLLINLGMWFERYVIVVTSLAQDFLPSNWGYYTPTRFDIGVLIGSFGMFFTFFLLFVRVIPTLAMAEIKAVLRHPAERKQPLAGATHA
jgi:Ni/Fe-hydrogenase subunit HybB-like protein